MDVQHFEMIESYIPFSLGEWQNFLLALVVIYAIIVFRYFLMAGIFWAVFYVWRPSWTRARQIYRVLPGISEQLFEIKWSLYTSVLFAIAGALMGLMWQRGWTRIYLKFDYFGFIYFPVSWFLFSFLQDAYFYWTHRWLHIPSVYKRFHAIHHSSLKPSPWASFSFHPVESLINAAAIPLLILIIPVHPVILLVHLTFMTLSAITNHMGFEILPRNGATHWFWRWWVSGVHHTEHHRYFRVNYGLFFTWWDHWFKTEHEKYSIEFAEVMKGNPTQ